VILWAGLIQVLDVLVNKERIATKTSEIVSLAS